MNKERKSSSKVSSMRPERAIDVENSPMNELIDKFEGQYGKFSPEFREACITMSVRPYDDVSHLITDEEKEVAEIIVKKWKRNLRMTTKEVQKGLRMDHLRRKPRYMNRPGPRRVFYY